MKKKRPIRLLSFLSGMCFALPFLLRSALSAPIAYFSGIPALLLLFSLLTDGTERKPFFFLRMGFYFSFGYYIGVYHWFLYMYPLDFIADFSALEAAGVVFVALVGLSLVATACFTFIIPNVALLYRTRPCKERVLLLPLLFASVFTVFSYLISFTWMGVPWGMIAITQAPLPALAMTSSLFGSYFVTFIVVLTGGFLALALLRYYRTRRENGAQAHRNAVKRAALPGILALSVFFVNLAAGCALYLIPHTENDSMTATLVQGNVTSREKWNGVGEDLFTRYDRLVSSLEDSGSDLIIWSETAITTGLDSTPASLDGQSVRAWLSELAKKTNAAQLVGHFSYEGTGEDGKTYNTLSLVNRDGTLHGNVYHKRHLVPFGEYVPMKPVIDTLLPFMSELVLMNEFTPGTDSKVFDTEHGKLGALICFDSIYEELARDATKDGAEILIISTNDSWFDDSIALYQHNAQAVLRAMENGRYVLRCANTGISSVITDKGDVIASLAPNVEGVITEEVPLYGYETLYTRIGNLFVYLNIAALLALPTLDVILRLKERKAT